MERKAAKLQMEWNKVPDRLNRKLYLPSDRTDLYEMLTLWGVIVLTSVLILLGTAQKMFSLLALGLAAYATVFGKDANTVILLVAITPIANIFKASPGSTSFHTYLMLLYSLKTFLVKKSLNAVSVLFAIFFIAVQFATYHLETTRTMPYSLKCSAPDGGESYPVPPRPEHFRQVYQELTESEHLPSQ